MGRLINRLGKWLFPNLPRDMRRRRMNNLLVVLSITFVVIIAIVLVALLKN